MFSSLTLCLSQLHSNSNSEQLTHSRTHKHAKTPREFLMNIFAHVQIPLFFCFCFLQTYIHVLSLRVAANQQRSFTQRNTYSRTHTRHTKPGTCSRVPLSGSQTHRDDLRYRSGPLYFYFHILRFIYSQWLYDVLFHRWRVWSESPSPSSSARRRRFILKS